MASGNVALGRVRDISMFTRGKHNSVFLSTFPPVLFAHNGVIKIVTSIEYIYHQPFELILWHKKVMVTGTCNFSVSEKGV